MEFGSPQLFAPPILSFYTSLPGECLQSYMELGAS
ncbi:hypothetical protein QLX08_002151 [Tetragonisca angustula]|uniref:Uncharacterized protein n=1 Tax=Tetragonisca angustula TaxID=166442 RepID=A0AAW1ACR7_9HYME